MTTTFCYTMEVPSSSVGWQSTPSPEYNQCRTWVTIPWVVARYFDPPWCVVNPSSCHGRVDCTCSCCCWCCWCWRCWLRLRERRLVRSFRRSRSYCRSWNVHWCDTSSYMDSSCLLIGWWRQSVGLLYACGRHNHHHYQHWNGGRSVNGSWRRTGRIRPRHYHVRNVRDRSNAM